MICIDTLKLLYTQTHISTWACAHTQTHILYIHSAACVSCGYNLQSDTWRLANNYKPIKQANPSGVEAMRESWQISCWKQETESEMQSCYINYQNKKKKKRCTSCMLLLDRVNVAHFLKPFCYKISRINMLYLSAELNITIHHTVF